MISNLVVPAPPFMAVASQNGMPAPLQYPDVFAYDCAYQSAHVIDEENQFLPPPLPPRKHQLLTASNELPTPALASLRSKVFALMIIVAGTLATVIAWRKYRKNINKISAAKRRKKPLVVTRFIEHPPVIKSVLPTQLAKNVCVQPEL